MILQALCEYYERKAAAEPESVAPPGFEWKEIPFVFELTKEGAVVQIEDPVQQRRGQRKWGAEY